MIIMFINFDQTYKNESELNACLLMQLWITKHIASAKKQYELSRLIKMFTRYCLTT